MTLLFYFGSLVAVDYVYLTVCLSVCLSVYLSVCLYFCPMFCFTIYLSIASLDASTHLFKKLCLSVSPSVRPFRPSIGWYVDP